MQTILLPTDFSTAANNALHYGAQLALQLGASLHLLHFYTLPITMSDMPVLAVSSEELRKNAEDGLERHKEELQQAYPGLQAKIECRMGSLSDEIAVVCDEIKPRLVIMGTEGTSSLEQFLFGSNTLSAIKHITYPVIVVPVGYTYKELKTAVLAADLTQTSENTQQELLQLLSLFKTTLHIVHVKNKNEEARNVETFETLAHLNPTYTTITDDEVTDGLQRYAADVNADLLIVLPHQHSAVEAFFFKTHTRQFIQNAEIPVLCVQ